MNDEEIKPEAKPVEVKPEAKPAEVKPEAKPAGPAPEAKTTKPKFEIRNKLIFRPLDSRHCGRNNRCLHLWR
jgi:hypothetical protein